MNNMNNSYDWHLKDSLLTFVDTGEQWQVPDWTNEDFENFIVLPDYEKLEVLDELEEWVS